MRDHTKYQVFNDSYDLVVEVYRRTKGFPVEERFGLQSQIRRAAASVPANIVEGCSRQSQKELAHFFSIALASASEVRFHLDLAHRLEMLASGDHEALIPRYDAVIRMLAALHLKIRSEGEF